MNDDRNRHHEPEASAETGTPPAEPRPAAVEDRVPPSPKPPKSVGWLPIAAVVVAIGLALWLGARFSGPISRGQERLGQLVASGGGEHAGHDHAGVGESRTTQYYTCGMHPWVVLPAPGDCPICGMDLVPLDPAKFTGEVSIDPVVVQNIGVRVAPVVEGPLTRQIRTVGSVDYNERLVRDVNTKVGGWIEKLYVDSVGEEVAEGQPLFDLYSPQLYAAQEEYLLAKKSAGTGTGVDLLESARTRLEFFDIGPEQIAALEEAGVPTKTLTIESPHRGVVIDKHANEGMKVDPGMRVYRIADLSKVWVLVTLYEYQLPFVEVGQKAVMTLPYVPGQEFEGEVIYIYPYLEQRTREVQVRLEFDNEGGILKPGMFASVTLENTIAREATLAPRSAVIDTGERQMAFVSLGEGRFEPRRVRLGAETGDGMVQILDGLKPGEMVVTSGQFLLDSEAKVREALAKMVRGDMAADQKPQVESAASSELESLPAPVAAALSEALDAYFAIGDALASDSTGGVPVAADALGRALDRLVVMEIPSDPHFWHRHEEAAAAASMAAKLAAADTLPAARETFAKISIAMDKLFRATGIPPGYEREVLSLHCPMYRDGQGGATWLQPAGGVRNPFFGASMLECFDAREALPVTGKGQAQPEAAPSDEPAAAPLADGTPGMQAGEQAGSAQASIDAVALRYLEAQRLLTENKHEAAAAALRAMVEQTAALPQPPAALAGLAVTESADAEAVRAAFAQATTALVPLFKQRPPSTEAAPSLYLAYCPMVDESWLQAGDTVANPFDPGMLRCGSIKEQIALRPRSDGGN